MANNLSLGQEQHHPTGVASHGNATRPTKAQSTPTSYGKTARGPQGHLYRTFYDNHRAKMSAITIQRSSYRSTSVENRNHFVHTTTQQLSASASPSHGFLVAPFSTIAHHFMWHIYMIAKEILKPFRTHGPD